MPRTMCLVALLIFSSIASAQTPTPARRTGTPQQQTKAPAQVKETFHPADPAAEIEVVRERFDNGDVRVEREVTLDTEGNYIRHGSWTLWSESGAEIAKGTYQDNRRDGQWMRIYGGTESEMFKQAPFNQFKAPFASRGEFLEGRLDGSWTISDAEGRVVTNWQFQNGQRHGTWTWSFPNGKLMRQVNYVNGLIDGGLLVWDETGELTVEHKYQSGRRLAVKTESHPSGEKKSEGMYLFAKRVMETPDEWWTATPANYYTVGKDDRHGRWTTWHPSGQVECQGTYEYGLRADNITWWYLNGQTRLKGEYQAGKPMGTWVWFHANGQKATLGQYANGEPSGNWIYWNDAGRLIQRSDLSLASTVAPKQVDKTPKTTRRMAPTR